MGYFVVGGILCLAGLVWFFLVGRPWDQKDAQAQGLDNAAQTSNPIVEIIKALVEFAKKLPSPYLPGVVLLFAGLVVIGLGAWDANKSADDSNPTPSTSPTPTITSVS